MPLEPVKIPQNVYVEDRIIGPVTLKQLIIMGLGSGFSYIMYASVSKVTQPTILLTILLWSPTLVAAAFAFLKINDLSLFNIILLMIEHMNKPSQRAWCPHRGISINIVTKAPPSAANEQQARKKVQEASRLAELTWQMEKRQADLSTIGNANFHATEQPSVAAAGSDDAAEQSEPRSDESGSDPEPIKPVDRTRITASQATGQPVDGLSDLSSFKHIFKQ